jgi:leucyl/phenylalanyl-tRNA--protein transferase
MQLVLTSELLLEAYRQGLFPMAYNSGSPIIHWVCPELRGQLSITEMHIPRSLRKAVRKALKTPSTEIKINTAFEQVIALCGETTQSRPETWINGPIEKAFIDLHNEGHAHSIEYWENGALTGGLYGLSIGSAFCGESMFSRAPNASKIALVHLVARLWAGGYTILDTQFTNEHLEQFGVFEIPHKEYIENVHKAVIEEAGFLLTGVSEREIIENYFTMRQQ